MRMVLDSNIALKWVLPEPDSAKAIRIRDELHHGIHELLAPDVYPVEVGHSLTRAERQGRIGVGAAWPFWQSVMADVPSLHPSIPLMARALDISSRMRIGVYDCLYVVLAESQGCVFLTADGRLVNALQSQFPFVVDFATIP